MNKYQNEFQTKNKVNPVFLFGIFLTALLLSLFSLDPLLIFVSVMFLPLIYYFTFRDNEPQVIFIAMMLSYLSITIKIYYAIFFQKSFTEYSESNLMEYTTVLSLFGLFFFLFGIYVSIRKITFTKNNTISSTLLSYNPRRIITLYIFSFIISSFLKGIGLGLGGFAQFTINISYLHNGFIFILIAYAYYTNKNVKITILIILIEIVLSLSGFFAGFKDYFLIIAASILAFKIQFNFRQTISLVLITVGAIYFSVIWTAIKPEYRKFLSGGESSQYVVVSQSDSFGKLAELFVEFNNKTYDFEEIYYAMVDRISYTEFFSLAVEQVPLAIAHENGKLFTEAIEHILLPRILNPNKAIIWDSEMVNKYTGRLVAGELEGTSFSLGFMAECYIDFGPYLMHLPIFFVGLLMGFIYRYILTNSLNKLWGSALVMNMLFIINCNGTPTKKVFGYVFMYFIVYLFFRFFALKKIDKYLRGSFIDKL